MYKLAQTNVTKSFLLNVNPAEVYFEHYLGVPVKKGLFNSPSIIRIDRTPTCAFYKNKKGVLMYKDFAGPSFDFAGCVMYIFGCSYYKALKIIANDFGLISIPKLEKNLRKMDYTGYILKETEKSKIQVELQAFSDKEVKWWSSFGILIHTLHKFKVFSIKSIFLNGNYFNSSSETSPIYGYFGGKNSEGNELWRLYMPTKKKYRFLSNWSSSILQGSKQLPKSGSHCILSKSMKDLMLLYEYGFISCATTSENVLISEAQHRRINTRFNNNILVFFDNDLAGVRGAKKYKKAYNTRCIFIKRKHKKDISDLYKKVSATVFWGIVDELNSIINDDTIRKTKHFYIF